MSVHFTLKVLLSLDGVVFGKPHYTKDGSPFLVNCSKFRMKIIELLLKHGANPNYMRAGKTALNYAVENDDIEMAKFLLDSGADPNVSDPNVSTE
ncbi:hypothetical protein PRECH8_06170 [Insulibacter thermoxylanivorax]|uniref:Ankyrin repeat-containing protein n=1 Tax=Insulibacter thermoxylanivorax TaxID=2749268 RepID=A0A916QF25_9BACL|nr:ankyrin repeat domain-containing protein [Insulibacter thermoxylanivorax]GFR37321.1 hypothetical protein PRECH8_06170 [Insulibacter thermoxylanivorax]